MRIAERMAPSAISMRAAPFVVVALLAALSIPARSEENAHNQATAWLDNARTAMSQLNYQGMVTYLKDKTLESLMVYHGAANGIEYERLLSVNSPLREVIRSPEKVTCYFPDSRSMFVESKPARQSFLLDLPKDLNDLSKYYSYTLLGTEHVAQRLARLVNIEPLDDFRYGRKLWVDVESKLPLKYELIDETNQVVEQMIFNSLSVKNSIPAQDLEPSTRIDSNWKIKQHEALPADSLKWTLNDVPGGFRMVSYMRFKRGPDNRTIDHILLSDGFSSVSIYVDQLVKDFFTAQPKKVGAVNSYTRKLDEYLVTVMGEVPPKTVRVIADGIKQQ
jgi:sigma-E factor negative regulatory protein RseB